MSPWVLKLYSEDLSTPLGVAKWLSISWRKNLWRGSEGALWKHLSGLPCPRLRLHTFCLGIAHPNQDPWVWSAHKHLLMAFSVLKAFRMNPGYLLLRDLLLRVSTDSGIFLLKCSWYLEKIEPLILIDSPVWKLGNTVWATLYYINNYIINIVNVIKYNTNV